MKPRFVLSLVAVSFTLLAVVPGCGPRSTEAGEDQRSASGGVAFASLDYDGALARARAERKVVMLDVYTDWCGWCKKLDRETYGDVRVAAALKNVISIRVNAEKGGESVAAKYGVRGFPTVLFLSASGDVVRKVEGYVDADEMLRIVASLRTPA